jgi:photosystem II stability/assembly factor-like uncharacterized protein
MFYSYERKNIMRKINISIIATLILICSTNIFAQWKSFDLNSPSGGYVNFVFAEDNYLLASASEEGVYESFDNAENWHFTGLKEPIFEVLDFAKNDSVVYAASTHGFFRKGIYEDSWSLVDSTFLSMYNDIEILNNNIFLIITNDGLLQSDDNGHNWIKIDSIYGDHEFKSIAANDSSLFVASYNKIYKSNDLGFTWIKSDSGISFDGFYSLAINDSIITCLAKNNKIAVSMNFGETWEPISLNIDSQIYGQKLDGENMYLTGDNGVYKYSIVDSILTNITYDLPVNYTPSIAINDSLLFVSTIDGIYKCPKDGQNWQLSNSGLNAIVVESFAENKEQLFASSLNYGIFISEDKGKSWSKFENSINEKWIYGIFGKDGVLLVGTDSGLYLSENSGEEWEKVNELRANSFVSVGEKIYAAGLDGLIISEDNGYSWRNTQYWIQNIHQIAAIGETIILGSYNNGIYVYVCDDDEAFIRNEGLEGNGKAIVRLIAIDSTLYSITYSGTYVSTNLGLSWERTNLEEFGGEINAIVNLGANHFVGSTNGIYKSTDDGVNWELLDDSKEIGKINSMYADTENFYVASVGKIWQKPLIDLLTEINDSKKELPLIFELSQNYPNPFNPSTTISYSIPENKNRESAIVSLVVYDILGSKVATLVNEQENAGNYKVRFKASNLTSGIYFYRLQSGDFSETKKLVLLR